MGNLFFFWGQEEFLLNSEIEQIKNKHIDKNYESMSYRKLHKPTPDDLITAIRSRPMMFGNTMYVIDMSAYLFSKGTSKNDDNEISNEDDTENDENEIDLEQLEKAFQNIADTNIIVLKVVIPLDSKKKVDTRKKIYKLISKYAEEKQFPLFRPFDKELPQVVINLAKNQGLKINTQFTKALIEQIGVNMGIINSELIKLALTIYPNKEPTLDDIKNICTQKDDVFTILNAIFNKDMDKALLEMKKVFEKSHYLQVLGAIQTSLRNAMLTKIYFQKIGKTETAKKLGLMEFIVEKNYNSMSKITLESLYKLKNNLLNAEYSIKNGDAVNPENTIEMALMEI